MALHRPRGARVRPPTLIERLAANLVDNAVQHNAPGGMIELTTTRQDGRAVLSAANSGPAIPPGDVERLFQPFQRLAPVRTSYSHDHGHGLGLSIVRAIAAAHGAALSAHARPEGGLHIELSFPADDARAGAERSAPRRSHPGRPG
jgi:signal transduction histidine kinase